MLAASSHGNKRHTDRPGDGVWPEDFGGIQRM
jgi:hypothetical protein